jgi:peptide/nickel transport system substrate-binding protein
LLVASACLVALVPVLAGRAGGSGVPTGGTLRIATASTTLQSIDPAILGGAGGFGSYLAAVCEMPLAFAPETGTTGSRVVPQAAEGYPRVSRNRKTFTFTIRRGLRFASGAPLTARNYVDALNRSLDPRMHPDDAQTLAAAGGWSEIAGAVAKLEGRATSVSGIRARGRELIFTLDRPDSSFPLSVAADPELLCPVPADLPVVPEGIGAPFSGGGPYFIARWLPGEEVDFERNRFYGGVQPHHVDRFVLTLAGAPETTLSEIDSGRLDWADALPASFADLAARYGVGKSQFFVHAMPVVNYLALNTSQPLFAGNPKLREAVNFAIDRGAIARAFGPYVGTATDQYIPSSVSGFTNADLYPLNRPDLRRARALAKGNTRSGKAVFYARDDPRGQAIAQIVQADLAKIGIDVQIQTFPQSIALEKMGTRGEPFDIGVFGLVCDADPACFLGQLDGRTITASNNLDFSYFDSRRYDRLIEQASALPLGRARERAFGRLDVEVARNEAPLAALVERNGGYLFSKRVGCISFADGFLDFTALCLK